MPPGSPLPKTSDGDCDWSPEDFHSVAALESPVCKTPGNDDLTGKSPCTSDLMSATAIGATEDTNCLATLNVDSPACTEWAMEPN